jgi:hypothetical protein
MILQDETAGVVAGLGAIIRAELAAFSSEYWSPHMASEQSEAELKFRRKRITALRVMRSEFENLMYGMEHDTL